jgi:hypothetical protein
LQPACQPGVLDRTVDASERSTAGYRVYDDVQRAALAARTERGLADLWEADRRYADNIDKHCPASRSISPQSCVRTRGSA